MSGFHKFKTSQHVELIHRTAVTEKTAVIGTFEIIRLLPADEGGINQYHLRSLLDRQRDRSEAH